MVFSFVTESDSVKVLGFSEGGEWCEWEIGGEEEWDFRVSVFSRTSARIRQGMEVTF